MLLLLDFDGVFAPVDAFWELLQIYGAKKKIEISETARPEIIRSITKNENEVNETLRKYGIDDLQFLNELYEQHVTLKPGAVKFLEYCKSNGINYLFFSAATPGRIIKTFSKHHLQIDSQDIYSAKSKNAQEIEDFKKNYWIPRFGDNHPWIYIDDYPFALAAGKKNGFTTILMSEGIMPFEDQEEYLKQIDHTIKSFSRLKELIENLR